MNNSFFQTAEKLNKEHRRTRRWHKVITVMAAIVVFCTTYALILPAITWERHLLCDTKEHTHATSCYADVVVMPEKRELTCSVAEHVHGDNCYEEVTTYVCGLEETEEHQHTADCMQTERVLTCEQSEHTHGDSCYHITPAVTERELICNKTEHVHTDACYDAPPSSDSGYYCGYAEHSHDKSCYFEDGSLRCTMQEHTHTLSCQIDKTADLETATEWERTFADVKLGDNWAENVLAIADTQLGYTESAKNFVIDDEKTGAVRGYSRYGAWYGDPYGDWCAMFASFCIDHAGVKDFPLDSNCGTWIKALSNEDCLLYHPAGSYFDSYIPRPGDLIFFDWDAEKQVKAAADTAESLTDAQLAEAEAKLIEQATHDVDHVGLVYELIEVTDTTPAQIKTIEGNNGNTVAYHTYDLDDVQILGYGELPEAYERVYYGDDYTVTAKFDKDAGIPFNAMLKAEKIPHDSALYEQYYQQSVQAMLDQGYANTEEDLAISYLQFYDIGFYADGQKIEPNGPVNIVISSKETIDPQTGESSTAIHFADNGTEILEAQISVSETGENEKSFSFAQSSFSVTGVMLAAAPTTTYEPVTTLQEGDQVIIQLQRSPNYYLTNTVADNGVTLSANLNDAKVWTIEKRTSDGVMLFKSSTGKYLTVGKDTAGLGGSYRAEPHYQNGYWILTRKEGNTTYYLNQYGGPSSTRAAGYGQNSDNDDGSRWIISKAVSGGDVPPSPTPSSFDSAFEHNKYIDALRDNTRSTDNPDTDLDNKARSGNLPVGDDAYDLYRLYLDMTGKQEPMDLLVVVDGSGSMDKTDMDGGMARDTAITQFLNGSTNSVTNDGFISYFLGLNSENQVSVVQFYGVSGNRDSHNISTGAYSYTGDSKVLKRWTHSNAFVDCANQYNNGTNYEAGLKRATEMFNSVRDDGHRKIMLFMSDGVPTYFLIDNSDVGFTANNYTLRNTDTGKRWGTGSYNNTTNYPYCKAPSKRAFDEFMAANKDVMVFTVGVSEDISATSQSESQSPEVLQYMADNGHGEFFSVTSNMDELKLRLESIFYPADVTITDYLSKYVRYYDKDPDVLVTMTKKTDKSVTKLYENGAVTADGQGILSRVTFTDVDSSQAPTGDYTGIVKAIFQPGYQFQPDYTYTLSFNVQTTQTAYNEYAANIAGGQNAYGGVTGDEGTDYPGNTTSSQKPGFHSNHYADVTYKVSNTPMGERYEDPVIQVKATQIDVEKVWSDGAAKHDADKIEAELYMVNGTSETLIASVELNKGNNWKATFTNLPAGNNTYKVVEKDDSNNPILTDYEANYTKTPATGTTNEKWTITNTRKTTELKIYKVDMNGNKIITSTATFALYDNAELTKPIDTYETVDGELTITDLQVGQEYWLKETKAPDGFYLLEEAQKFTVDATGKVNGISSDNAYFKWNETSGILLVYNTNGYELPQSGGSGLIPIYASGILLMAGALVYGYSMRRKRERRQSN